MTKEQLAPPSDIDVRLSTEVKDGQDVISMQFYEELEDHASPNYPLGPRGQGRSVLDQKARDIIDAAVKRGQVPAEISGKLIKSFRSAYIIMFGKSNCDQ